MKEKLLATLDNSKNYTIAVATAMPDDRFKDKLINTSWSFNELLSHIAYGISWWERNYIEKVQTDWDPFPAASSKALALSQLNHSFDSLKDTLQKLALNDDVMYGFKATLDHITHHRGQAVLFLRNLGITPPEYTY
ncbi:Uncharacterized damage-inducible protein DinB (forms a four-helix bundle) [Chitinophaga sp. CF118]|uniref:DinB family protein n=1 Tax=Chitinophaga sp. CF118 TaxID=1884367 RepID=UPI0008F051B8|nr:DinB family protein [Chitinophaga sp. CF118]SFF02137.1 Uncharacterized damage-inducible protein DinB (forms a four-helix bundle) [Chitinophaga sp. CF118]